MISPGGRTMVMKISLSTLLMMILMGPTMSMPQTLTATGMLTFLVPHKMLMTSSGGRTTAARVLLDITLPCLITS